MEIRPVKENPRGAGDAISPRVLYVLAALAAGCVVAGCYMHQQIPRALTEREAGVGGFSGLRAHGLLRELTAGGARVAGSPRADRDTVAVLVNELARAARALPAHRRLDVDVQVADGGFTISFMDGMSSVYRGVRNVVGRLSNRTPRGPPRPALLLNSHFDTVPDSPGASDDGAGCALLLETVRALGDAPGALQHDAVFLWNGAEENIMQASHGFITQHAWARDVRAFLNVEACGAGGREVLFQAGPGAAPLVRAYAASASRPFASSLAQDIFRSGLVPGDTDFRIFRDYGGLAGLDLAWVARGHVYHTGLDTAERVPPGSLQRAGDNVAALAAALLRGPELSNPSASPTSEVVYFDVLGSLVLVLDDGFALGLAGLAAALTVLRVRQAARECGRGYYREVTRTGGALAAAGAGGALGAALLGAAVEAAGGGMSWYGRVWLLAPLYALPATGGAGLLLCRLLSDGPHGHRRRGRAAGDALQVAWSVAALLLLAGGVRSGFLPLVWSLSGAAAGLADGRGGTVSRGAFWAVAGCPGCVLTLYLSAAVLQMFAPIAGRAGVDAPLEVAVALLAASSLLVALSWMAPAVVSSREIRPALLLLVATGAISSILVTMTPLGFPYSPEAPQRYMVFHTRRELHNSSTPPTDGYWIPALDRHTVRAVLQEVPEFRAAVETRAADCAAMLYCGAPYYLPVLSFISRGFWLPAPRAPETTSVRVQLLPHNDTAATVQLRVQGPPHVALIVSPAAGTRLALLQTGRVTLAPLEGVRWGERRTYFVLLHRAHDRDPHWELALSLVRDQPATAPGWVSLSVTGHCMSGDCKTDEATRRLLARLPSHTAHSAWSAHMHLLDL